MNKAIIKSYLENLLAVVLALIATTIAGAGVSSPFELALSDWLGVANGLWAAAIPTLLRYFNGKDPAFGRVFKTVSDEVTKKLEEAAEEAKKAATKAVAKTAPKKAVAKVTPKPPVTKK
jgi:hypothetical protein